MNARRAVSENCVRLAATKASASEQMASTTARPASASTPSGAMARRPLSSTDRGHQRSEQRGGGGGADHEEAAGVQEVVLRRLHERAEPRALGRVTLCRALSTHSSRPSPIQTKPTTHAASMLARKRASTISGWPGRPRRWRPARSGFTAGAASRNVTAAAGVTPAGHQPPGDRHRAALAAGERHAGGRRHRHRQRRLAGRHHAEPGRLAARRRRSHRSRRRPAPGTAAPGREMATKMVAQLCSASASTAAGDERAGAARPPRPRWRRGSAAPAPPGARRMVSVTSAGWCPGHEPDRRRSTHDGDPSAPPPDTRSRGPAGTVASRRRRSHARPVPPTPADG